MTTSLPVFDFSTSPEERAAENAKKSMKDAPVVAKMKAKKLVAPKKAAAKGTKSGRVVGISADENKMLLNLLQTVQNDSNYATIVKDAAFSKILARYNKN